MFFNVILGGDFSSEARKIGVEGSHAVRHGGKSPEILRLRNSPFGRIAPLRMTVSFGSVL